MSNVNFPNNNARVTKVTEWSRDTKPQTWPSKWQLAPLVKGLMAVRKDQYAKLYRIYDDDEWLKRIN